MNNNERLDTGLMEGRAYTLGREGHIYIDSPAASKQHAEIEIIKGRVYLRDLNSTNGTYLVKNNTLVYFEEGYVNPLQLIVIGDQKYTVQGLLAIARDFAAFDDNVTQVNFVDQVANS